VNRKTYLLAGVSILGVLFGFTHLAYAEDCTAVLPGGDCTLDEDTTAPLTINNTVTLTVGGSVTIGHTVDGGVSNAGTITTNSGSVTVNQTAAIGSTAPIDSLSIGDGDTWNASANIITDNSGGDANNGAVQGDLDLGTADGGEVLNMNGGITVRAQIDGNAADNINVGADANGGDFTVSGAINSVILNVNSGTLTTTSSIGGATALADININTGGRLNLGGASNAAQTLDLDGTLGIDSGSSLTVTTYNADANNGNIVLGVNRDTGATTNGAIAFTGGGAVDLSGSSFSVNIESGSEVLGSETITNVIQGNGGATILPTIVDNSFLYDFTLQQAGNNANLIINRKSVTDSATTGNNAKAASVLLSELEVSENADIVAVQLNLANAPTQEAYNEVLESTQPAQDAGTSAASGIVSDKTVDLALRRLLYLRNGSRLTGVSSGDEYEDETIGGRAWVQGFGSSGEQSARDGIDGYDVTSKGVSVGYDTGGLNEKIVLGVSGTYATTEVSANNANSTESDIKSYQLGMYGTYNTDDDLFINGAFIWGVNDVTSTRKNVGGTGAVARAEYDSQQITVYSDIGADYKRDALILTPSVGAQYSYLETENYRERGAGGLNLRVNEDAVHALEIGPKLGAKWEYQTQGGKYVMPEVSVGYSYDLIGDESENIATLQGGGGQLQLEGFESQRHTVNAGTGVSLSDEVWEVKANYDFELQGDLNIHSASLRGVYKF